MNFFLFLTLLLSVYSCSDETNKKPNETVKVKDSLAIRSDSFNFHVNITSLQEDIQLDTSIVSRNKRNRGIDIVIPKLSKKEHPEVFEWIKKFVQEQKKEFYESTKDDVVEYDSSLQAYTGCSMGIQPKNLYRTERLISFVIEVDQGCGGPIGFKYSVINFDNTKKKQISLGDYFVLKTSSDTAFLEKIIGRAIIRDFSIIDYLRFNDNINFSFDSSHVYFCFDRYDMYHWGISSVKKEYMLEHINPLYR